MGELIKMIILPKLPLYKIKEISNEFLAEGIFCPVDEVKQFERRQQKSVFLSF